MTKYCKACSDVTDICICVTDQLMSQINPCDISQKVINILFGQLYTEQKEGLSENLICIDYGRLFKTDLDGYYPVIVGSRPPPDDLLWKILKILDLQLKLTIELGIRRKGLTSNLQASLATRFKDIKDLTNRR
uniref:Uncharacterized protein n=1 Tax=Rhizophagus irregularis (strain DAOM 181602 / DAOM 197198 / MUCL 43194) TaxID=747089 RepID=U9U2G3_RHIID